MFSIGVKIFFSKSYGVLFQRSSTSAFNFNLLNNHKNVISFWPSNEGFLRHLKYAQDPTHLDEALQKVTLNKNKAQINSPEDKDKVNNIEEKLNLNLGKRKLFICLEQFNYNDYLIARLEDFRISFIQYIPIKNNFE